MPEQSPPLHCHKQAELAAIAAPPPGFESFAPKQPVDAHADVSTDWWKNRKPALDQSSKSHAEPVDDPPGFEPRESRSSTPTARELCLQSGLRVTFHGATQQPMPKTSSMHGSGSFSSFALNKPQYISPATGDSGLPGGSNEPRPRISRLGMQALTGALQGTRQSARVSKASGKASMVSSVDSRPVRQHAGWQGSSSTHNCSAGSEISEYGEVEERYDSEELPPGFW